MCIRDRYDAVRHASLGPLTLEHWAADGGLALFFFIAGLEPLCAPVHHDRRQPSAPHAADNPRTSVVAARVRPHPPQPSGRRRAHRRGTNAIRPLQHSGRERDGARRTPGCTPPYPRPCLLYTSDAADDLTRVDL